MDGFTVLRRLRESRSAIPVIVLTARDSVTDTVRGARGRRRRLHAEAVPVRRAARPDPAAAAHATATPGGHGAAARPGRALDLRTRAGPGRRPLVDLSAREFALAEMFLRNPGQVLSREQLLSHVWGYDFDPSSNVVDVYVGYLRKKLGPALITTVRGMGYRSPTSQASVSSRRHLEARQPRLGQRGHIGSSISASSAGRRAARPGRRCRQARSPCAPGVGTGRAAGAAGSRPLRPALLAVVLVARAVLVRTAGSRRRRRTGVAPRPHMSRGGPGDAARARQRTARAPCRRRCRWLVRRAAARRRAGDAQVDQPRRRAHDDVARLDVEVHDADARAGSAAAEASSRPSGSSCCMGSRPVPADQRRQPRAVQVLQDQVRPLARRARRGTRARSPGGRARRPCRSRARARAGSTGRRPGRAAPP